MHEADLFEIFSVPLADSGINYCVTGSVAAMLYGEPRLTHDIDLVVEINGLNDIGKLQEMFPSDSFYLPPEEIIRIESKRERRGHFNVIHLESGYKADFYLAGEDPFHFWALQHARRIMIAGRDINVAPPEYVICRKLQYFKEGGSDKHLKDIKAVLRNPDAAIDEGELGRWVEILDVKKQWQLCQE